jgi:transposase
MTGAPRATSDPSYCKACLDKQRKIDALQEENKRLKDKLRRQERTAREAPFGSSTPSAKRLVKSSSPPAARARRGGAVPGHEGHGRSSVCEDEADAVETLAAPDTCPDCGCALEDWGVRDRTVYDCEPVRRTSRLMRIGGGHCPKCGKTHRRRVPGVLPRSICSNRLVAQAATWNYVQGQTLGAVARQFGLCKSTLIGQMHALAERFVPVDEVLVAAYRLAPVKHADETGWRNDGCNGSTWGVFTPCISIFRCRDTRSGDVAAEVLGPPEMHVGTLVGTLDAVVENPEMDIADYPFGPKGIASMPETPSPDSG